MNAELNELVGKTITRIEGMEKESEVMIAKRESHHFRGESMSNTYKLGIKDMLNDSLRDGLIKEMSETHCRIK